MKEREKGRESEKERERGREGENMGLCILTGLLNGRKRKGRESEKERVRGREGENMGLRILTGLFCRFGTCGTRFERPIIAQRDFLHIKAVGV